MDEKSNSISAFSKKSLANGRTTTLKTPSLQHSQKINQTLFDISWAVNTTADIEELYRFIHKALGNVLDVTNFFIAIVDIEQKTLFFPYHVDVTDDNFSTITDFDVNNSLTGLVVMRRKPILLRKQQLEERAANNGVWGPVPMVWMGVPLVVKDAIIGVMAVQSYSDEKMYNDQDLQVLAAVSHQIAIAIDRKRSHDALKKSERRFRQLFEQSNDAIVIYDAKGQIINCNHRASQMLGFSRRQLCKMAITQLLPDKKNLPPERVLQEIEANSLGLIETRMNKADGSLCEVEISSRFIEGGEQRLLQQIVRDISQRKKMEKEKQKLQSQLHQAQKMEAIGILAGGIAHDFNNILASIIGYTELALYDVEQDSQIKNNLEEIFKAGNRAKELVQQILIFAHKSDEAVKPVAVKPIVQEALKLIRASLPATIEIVARPASTSYVMANPTQIHQVFINLCTNAAQAMEDRGGLLEVGVSDVKLDKYSAKRFQNLEAGSYVKIRIADTGTGIAPNIMPSIFEPYFTTKAPGEGTGMGLAIVHRIVKQSGGEITVKTELGKGSTFEVYFPIVNLNGANQAEKKKSPATGAEQILFVDDEATIAMMSDQLLEHLGYAVTTCSSSLEALELFKQNPYSFDLVITDMTMPQLTGDNLARKLLAIRPDLPVILCTGYSKTFSQEDAFAAGIKAYLHKPVTIAQLAQTIRKIMDQAKEV